MTTQKQKKSKIKISKDDIKQFPVDEMIVDDFWKDLYNPKTNEKNNK